MNTIIDEINSAVEELQYELSSVKRDNIYLKGCINNAKEDLEKAKKSLINQEQSLIWTLYSILDGLAVEGEAREKAINEFKEHLKYYKDE